jgi:hypothetical protein
MSKTVSQKAKCERCGKSQEFASMSRVRGMLCGKECQVFIEAAPKELSGDKLVTYVVQGFRSMMREKTVAGMIKKGMLSETFFADKAKEKAEKLERAKARLAKLQAQVSGS